MFWKVYFWVILILSTVGFAMSGLAGLVGLWGWVDFLFSSGGWVGLFAYAYKKRFFVAKVWKSYLPLLILWDLAYNLALQPEATGKAADMGIYIGFVLLIPMYAALYLYAFKFMEEPEQSPAGGLGSRAAVAWVPGKWLYGLALFLFTLGGADYAVFISAKYGANIGAGLSDSFALLGLTAWWGAAGGLATVTLLKRRNSGQLVGVAPPTESIKTTALPAPESTGQTTPVKQENLTEKRVMKTRPTSVTVIAWILIVVGVVTLIMSTLTADNPMTKELMARTPLPISVQYVMLYLGLLITVGSGIGLLKGQNLARMLYISWSILGMLIGFATSPMKAALIPGLAMFGVFAFFLFRPKANQYFAET